MAKVYSLKKFWRTHKEKRFKLLINDEDERSKLTEALRKEVFLVDAQSGKGNNEDNNFVVVVEKSEDFAVAGSLQMCIPKAVMWELLRSKADINWNGKFVESLVLNNVLIALVGSQSEELQREVELCNGRYTTDVIEDEIDVAVLTTIDRETVKSLPDILDVLNALRIPVKSSDWITCLRKNASSKNAGVAAAAAVESEEHIAKPFTGFLFYGEGSLMDLVVEHGGKMSSHLSDNVFIINDKETLLEKETIKSMRQHDLIYVKATWVNQCVTSKKLLAPEFDAKPKLPLPISTLDSLEFYEIEVQLDSDACKQRITGMAEEKGAKIVQKDPDFTITKIFVDKDYSTPGLNYLFMLACSRGIEVPDNQKNMFSPIPRFDKMTDMLKGRNFVVAVQDSFRKLWIISVIEELGGKMLNRELLSNADTQRLENYVTAIWDGEQGNKTFIDGILDSKNDVVMSGWIEKIISAKCYISADEFAYPSVPRKPSSASQRTTRSSKPKSTVTKTPTSSSSSSEVTIVAETTSKKPSLSRTRKRKESVDPAVNVPGKRSRDSGFEQADMHECARDVLFRKMKNMRMLYFTPEDYFKDYLTNKQSRIDGVGHFTSFPPNSSEEEKLWVVGHLPCSSDAEITKLLEEVNCLLLTIGLPVKTTVTGNGSFDLKALRHSGDLVRIGVLMKSKMPGFMDLLLFSTLLATLDEYKMEQLSGISNPAVVLICTRQNCKCDLSKYQPRGAISYKLHAKSCEADKFNPILWVIISQHDDFKIFLNGTVICSGKSATLTKQKIEELLGIYDSDILSQRKVTLQSIAS